MGHNGEDKLRELLEKVPEDILDEVLEYEEESRERRGTKSKKPFPSNEDIVEGIMEVSGGIITRSNIDELYEAVLKRLEEKGFETRFVQETRFWRLVTSLVKKGRIKLRL
ncbi:MAG: hypothetical protein DRO12_04445 [Thermoprotei archaeon]|nr:MAG: hypothetical protein DRO12_04445 [Thermoprotei archaeon]